MMFTRAVVGLLAIIVAGAAVIGQGKPASAAAVRTWTGGGASNAWSDAGNWDTGIPVAGDTVIFPAAAARKTNENDLAPNLGLAAVSFDGAGYSITGNPIQVQAAGLLTNDPGAGTNTLFLDVGGAGAISQQSGTLFLRGDNSFTGTVDVIGGTLAVTTGTALGSAAGATSVVSPGTLRLSGGIDLGSEQISIGGEGDAGDGALQSASGTNRIGTLVLAQAATISVGNSVLVVGTLSQSTSGVPFTLVGGGKLQVEGDFFAGPGYVVAGNLTWNTDAQLFAEVDDDGLLRGTGLVSSISVAGGTVWPGSGGAPGILSVMNGTSFSSGFLKIDLDGPTPGVGYGQLATNGLSLNPAATFLDLDLTFTPAVGQVFTIVSNGGGAVSGTFSDLPEGGTFALDGFVFKISYKGGDGNDVTLTVLRQVAANLSLAMSAQPSPVAPGGLLIYTATVTNLGPDAAAGARFSLGTPVGTSFESVSGPANWTCSKPSPSVSISCTGSTLAADQSVTITLVFRVNAGATGPISATGAVSAQTNDPLSGNNSVTLSTPVGPGGGKPFRRFLIGLAADSAAGGE